MHGSRVAHEVRARPRIPSKELVWEHIALEAITRGTRRDQVAGSVWPSVRDRVYVIERRDVERQRNGAVDAASAAIAHGSVLECTLDSGVVEVPRAARKSARCAGERDSVETTSRHCTSLEKKKPRDGAIARAGWRERRLCGACRCVLFCGPGLHNDCRRRSLIGLRGPEVSELHART
jgi:hypothetical protein